MTNILCNLTNILCDVTNILCDVTNILCNVTNILCDVTNILCNVANIKLGFKASARAAGFPPTTAGAASAHPLVNNSPKSQFQRNLRADFLKIAI